MTWNVKNLGGGNLDGVVTLSSGEPFGLPKLGVTIDIKLTEPNDAGYLEWTAPAYDMISACSITITASTCLPDNTLVMSGTGTCSQPAEQIVPIGDGSVDAGTQPGGSAGPITIGDFTYTGYVPGPANQF
jgi:hypothetical protein